MGLKKTVESVSAQTNQSFEYIIIDGGSTDASASYLKENQSSFAYSCSEIDKGIYDAQNKGIAKSTGKYLLFLNAGDTLHTNQVVDEFIKYAAKSDKGIIYGNSMIVSTSATEELLIPPVIIDLYFWYRKTINHQAAFIRKGLFITYGLYDLSYRFCADFNFFLKVFVNEANEYQYFPCTVCNYFEGGFSSIPANFDKLMAERELILQEQLSRKDYLKIKRAYILALPFKNKVLAYVYQTPIVNELFRKVYPIISRSIKKKS